MITMPTLTSKPITKQIQTRNQSPLLGGKINNLKLPSLTGKPTQPINNLGTFQPPKLMESQSLRDIFDSNYFETLFEYLAPSASPIAPIGAVGPMKHMRTQTMLKRPTLGAKTVRMEKPQINKVAFHPGNHSNIPPSW